MRKLLTKIWDGIRSDYCKSLMSGLIPTLILMLFVVCELKQTKEQVELFREQMSYQREPVIMIYPSLVGRAFKLFIANVGNEGAENLRVNAFFFLVTPNQIYSWGQYEQIMAYMEGSERTPKQEIWPRGSLKPNEKFELKWHVEYALLKPFLVKFEENEEVNEMYKMRELMQGRFVLFIEYYFRKQSDFTPHADTAYLFYETGPVFERRYTDLRTEIGGDKIIRRLNRYLMEGPQLSIYIKKTKYEFYQHELLNPFGVKIVRTIERKNN